MLYTCTCLSRACPKRICLVQLCQLEIILLSNVVEYVGWFYVEVTHVTRVHVGDGRTNVLHKLVPCGSHLLQQVWVCVQQVTHTANCTSRRLLCCSAQWGAHARNLECMPTSATCLLSLHSLLYWQTAKPPPHTHTSDPHTARPHTGEGTRDPFGGWVLCGCSAVCVGGGGGSVSTEVGDSNSHPRV